MFQARARRRSRRRGPPETQLAHLQHFGRALVQRDVDARRRDIVMIRDIVMTRLRGRERLARERVERVVFAAARRGRRGSRVGFRILKRAPMTTMLLMNLKI